MKSAAFFLSLLAASAFADPARIGRVSFVEGEIIVLRADNSPAEAVVNTVISSGDSLRSGDSSRAEIQIGSLTLHLGAGSRLHFMQIDEQAVRAYLVQGALIARIRENPREFELSAPGFSADFSQPGRYRLNMEGVAAELAVREGEALVTRSTGERFSVAPDQTARIGREPLTIHAATSPDGLDRWAEARMKGEDRSIASRYLSREFTGYQDLDGYGAWEETPEYGAVWVPHASYTGWEPYRDGGWTFFHRKGWIWVDHAPWGFAPFHYGKWTYLNNIWCWVPGPHVKWSHHPPKDWPHFKPPHWKPPHWRAGAPHKIPGGVAIKEPAHGATAIKPALAKPEWKSVPFEREIRERERIQVPAARMESHRMSVSPARAATSLNHSGKTSGSGTSASGGVGLNRIR
ncbi:MAG: DUF6600 domain-containing protein [Burkholderiales bacterium]